MNGDQAELIIASMLYGKVHDSSGQHGGLCVIKTDLIGV